ncbi:hypothetical protein ABZS59_31605 [Streptomyces flaveolus]|uniref:hypothetical protein n=1 Tax=Streptomyces flaveolus TaxID=67297 RepID=UPI00339DDFC1
MDTAIWRDRDLTAEEDRSQLERDLRLAQLLGFTTPVSGSATTSGRRPATATSST